MRNFATRIGRVFPNIVNQDIINQIIFKVMMTIDQFNFAGKKAIVRVDFNVPLDENGNVTDDTRIRGALPTLKKILADGGSVIMMSHMGKPKGKVNPKMSLAQIVKPVSEALGVDVKFAPDCANASAEAEALKPGEALLLENLRFYAEEEGKPVGIEKDAPEYEEAKKAMKKSQKEFAKKLASYADAYVMDAFGTAHRKHASTAVIDEFFDTEHRMLGYLMEKEVQAVDNVLSNIKRPFTAIMGGSKVSTKIGIIENLLGKVDNLILCGGMTYTFAKAMGGEIGNSIVELDKLDVALDVIKKAKENGVNLVLGTDCIAADKFANDANTKVVPANAIPEGWEGLDAGPETRNRKCQDHPVERSCRRFRIRQLHRWFKGYCRCHCQSYCQRSLLLDWRRRLCGMHQQVWNGRPSFLHLYWWWCSARGYRRQSASWCCCHQGRITERFQ